MEKIIESLNEWIIICYYIVKGWQNGSDLLSIPVEPAFSNVSVFPYFLWAFVNRCTYMIFCIFGLKDTTLAGPARPTLTFSTGKEGQGFKPEPSSVSTLLVPLFTGFYGAGLNRTDMHIFHLLAKSKVLKIWLTWS